MIKVIKEDSDAVALQNDLDTLHKWSSTWLLKFHPQKCKHMRISRKTEDTDQRYNLDSYTLEKVDHEKDIGITLDENLKFEIHTANKIKKAHSMFALIRRIFEFLDADTFVPLYKTLVRVHLDYASSVWAPYRKKLITDLENVQRRVTKQLPGMKEISYEERLKILKLPTLQYRRIRGDMIEVFKIMNNYYDSDASINLPQQAGTTRGHDKKLYQRRYEKDIRKFYFTNRIVHNIMWNTLPNDVVNAPSINSFKNRLDSFWDRQPVKYKYDEPYLYGTGLKIYLAEDDN